MVPGGIYSHGSQGHRENTTSANKVQYRCGFGRVFRRLHEKYSRTISGDLGRFRQTFY
jgi:hypothetical protein